jgi:tRNA modification GTPase
MNLYESHDDTIVAISSPPGAAPRGIIRLSGRDSVRLTDPVFAQATLAPLGEISGHRRIRGMISIEPDCRVPGEVFLFRGPRSYTGEDGVEFHLPGSPPVLAMLLDRLISLGARHAQPGEFTARAVLAGRMDLTRAEGIGALINARSDGQLRAARAMMGGRLGGQLAAIQEEIGELLALVEAEIDFAEEPIEFISPDKLCSRLKDLAVQLEALESRSDSSEAFRVLPRILLLGRSNVGKSTLMNRLSGIDRSICSPIAGVTRDLLSADVRLGAMEAVLLDAAGADTEFDDTVAASRELTLRAATRVDLLCLVIDISTLPDATVFELLASAGNAPVAIVANKSDLLTESALEKRRTWLDTHAPAPFCVMSAKEGHSIETCRYLLSQALDHSGAALSDNAILLTSRQSEAIRAARDALARCVAQSAGIGDTIDRADTLAFELREAVDALGSAAGDVTTEELLGRIFAKFCIGK